MRSFLRSAIFYALGTSALCGPAFAGPLLSNGNFSQTSAPGNNASVPAGLCNANASFACLNVTGWTNTDGYSFVATGADLGVNHYGDIRLASFTANTLDNGAFANYIAADGNSVLGPKGTLSQSVTGLTVGDNYAVTFYQAAGEQSGSTGALSEQWEVSLGGKNQFASIMNYGGSQFVGWEAETLVFNATSTSELLSFLSLGVPGGTPPFALLEGVSIADVPEPSALMMLGMGALGLVLLRRARAQA
jgi:hypothetical protein